MENERIFYQEIQFSSGVKNKVKGLREFDFYGVLVGFFKGVIFYFLAFKNIIF